MADFVDWIKEAKNDLMAAENLGQAKLFAPACFHCQQAAEKALKAILIKSKKEFPKSHSLMQLAKTAGLLDKLSEELALLEADYSTTRYPDVYGKQPSALYTQKMFSQRVKAAGNIILVAQE
ncbi:HEPN domain-containing protein [Candidatus Micrarchaeota archaeon]|nr:HEPN domain-containing protein [Candidatus Micrarchaeota archaeon]